MNPNNLTRAQQNALREFPTYQKLISELPPHQLLINFEDINNIHESVSVERLTLNDMSVIYPFEHIPAPVDYLSRWLDYLNKFSNIAKVLTEIRAVAQMIYKSYGNLYLSDLKVIFEKIMSAEYGVFYNSIDAQRILYAFMQYSIERNKIIANKRIIYDVELEKYLDKVRQEVNHEVSILMKNNHADLSGHPYWELRNKHEKELLKTKLRAAREEFIIKNGDRPV